MSSGLVGSGLVGSESGTCHYENDVLLQGANVEKSYKRWLQLIWIQGGGGGGGGGGATIPTPKIIHNGDDVETGLGSVRGVSFGIVETIEAVAVEESFSKVMVIYKATGDTFPVNYHQGTVTFTPNIDDDNNVKPCENASKSGDPNKRLRKNGESLETNGTS